MVYLKCHEGEGVHAHAHALARATRCWPTGCYGPCTGGRVAKPALPCVGRVAYAFSMCARSPFSVAVPISGGTASRCIRDPDPYSDGIPRNREIWEDLFNSDSTPFFFYIFQTNNWKMVIGDGHIIIMLFLIWVQSLSKFEYFLLFDKSRIC